MILFPSVIIDTIIFYALCNFGVLQAKFPPPSTPLSNCSENSMKMEMFCEIHGHILI